jgi:hypothetical protein
MAIARKITVEVPPELLDKAQRFSRAAQARIHSSLIRLLFKVP